MDLFDESISFRTLGEEDFGSISKSSEFGPLEHLTEMTEGLDTWHNFDTAAKQERHD
jgi:hypothetical protein